MSYWIHLKNEQQRLRQSLENEWTEKTQKEYTIINRVIENYKIDFPNLE